MEGVKKEHYFKRKYNNPIFAISIFLIYIIICRMEGYLLFSETYLNLFGMKIMDFAEFILTMEIMEFSSHNLMLLLYSTHVNIIFILIFLIFAIKFIGKDKKELGLKFHLKDLNAFPFILIFLILNFILYNILKMLLSIYEYNFSGFIITSIYWSVFVFAEELIERAYLQSVFVLNYGIFRGVLMTSILVTLSHLDLFVDRSIGPMIFRTFLTFLVFIFLGYIYIRNRSLLLPFSAHLGLNLM